jgi:hypothetical protein
MKTLIRDECYVGKVPERHKNKENAGDILHYL